MMPGKSLFPLTRGDLSIAGCLAVVVILTGSMRMARGVCGVRHDDAIYVSTAKALADGDGYRLIGVPGAPAQTKFPILYPVMLAAVWKCWPDFPSNLLAMQWLSLISGAAAVALGYLYVLRFGYFTRSVAVTAALLTATASSFLYFATTTMAEMPFAVILIFAMWALDRHLAGPEQSRLAQLGLGILVALPFLCRTIGAPLVPIAGWLLFRSKQRFVWCMIGAGLIAAPWVVWSLAGHGSWEESRIDGYYTDYLGCWSSTGIRMVLRVFCWNTLAVALSSTEMTMEGLTDAGRQAFGSGLVSMSMMAIGAIPWLVILAQLRTRRALPYFMAAYLSVMLVWPWPPFRFLIPILPLLAAYLVAGFVMGVRLVGWEEKTRALRLAVVATLVVCNLGLLWQHARVTKEYGYPLLKLSHTPVRWSSYERMFAWIRKNTSPNEVIGSGLDSMVALYTNNRSFRPYVYRPGSLFYGDGSDQLTTTDELKAILMAYHPRYIVRTPMPGFSEERPFDEVLSELRQNHPEWLHSVYQDDDERFVIYKLEPQHAPSTLTKPNGG